MKHLYIFVGFLQILTDFSPAMIFQLLSVPLQHSFRLFHPLCPAFPNALRLWFYPCYLLEIAGRERRASMFLINDSYEGLGLPCEIIRRMPNCFAFHRVNPIRRLNNVLVCTALNMHNLSPYHFGTERISLFLPMEITMLSSQQ